MPHRSRAGNGISITEIRELFGKNVPKYRLVAAAVVYLAAIHVPNGIRDSRDKGKIVSSAVRARYRLRSEMHNRERDTHFSR